MVELLLTLLVLYGLQCLVLLPRGATLFLRPAEVWRASDGPGWRLLHPWPSAAGWLASRPALVAEGGANGGLRTRGPTPWLGAGYAEDRGVRLEPGGGQSVEARGSRVLIDGQPALSAASRLHAAESAERLRALAAEGADAEALLDRWLEDSFAAAELARTREAAAAATRWLGILSDVALLGLGVLLPGLAFWLGGERALLFFGPSYLVLHVALLALLGRAHRRLRPGRGDLFEVLFSAALYPPLLLRSAAELRRQALGGFHPAAVAAEILPRSAALDFLRAELARARGERERGAILGVVARLGSSEEALFAPPAPSDPFARSYCPTCRIEYRLDAGVCIDCDVALRPLAAEASAHQATGLRATHR